MARVATFASRSIRPIGVNVKRLTWPAAAAADPLFRSARKCRQVRWKLEHDRGDDARPLRNHPDWHGNKGRPDLFDRRIVRVLRDQPGRPRVQLGERFVESRGWPAHRPWDRAVHADIGARNLSRAFRSLLGRLERHALTRAREPQETFTA